MQIVSKSLDDTRAIAREFASSIQDGDVVLFYGDLGAGKTTFIKALCSALGYAGEVTSPTFTLLNEYSAKLPIYHFDMYRLKDSREALESGLDEILRGGSGVCLVEWPERIAPILPLRFKKIVISIIDANSRRFDIEEVV